MSDFLSKEDIYDKNGVLLLSKGHKITGEIAKKLLKLGSFKAEELLNFDVKHKTTSSSLIQAFGGRKKIRNNRSLEYPNKVLSTIIFESKTSPWWIYVNALSNYVDWLYTHSIDVAIISLMMAVELKYNDKELWNIGLGALLHDVGKLLVPKHIIQKPGPLNKVEKVYIWQHCELGMCSLEPFQLPRECTDIVLQHHERLDGSGYPKGLKGDEICRNARIVMIADAVDAITSGRPYKEPREMETAIKILRNEEEKYSQELIDLLATILELS